jgi:chitin disaccharide deacetylase
VTRTAAQAQSRPGIGSRGLLIVNADDWGRDVRTTNCIRDCARRKTVSAVSAMVFMEDSERAAALAREHGIDAGLHLNFTAPFTSRSCPAVVADRQRPLGSYLRRHRLAQVVFNPILARSFEYVINAQIDEFRRLYGADPSRVDGHHHMHLCANVLVPGLLPAGTLARRSFSFEAGEKGVVNRTYRRFVDGRLSGRHRLADYLFSLAPLEPSSRLERIFSLARQHVVEVETHPVQPDEYRFLTGGGINRLAEALGVVPAAAFSWSEPSTASCNS